MNVNIKPAVIYPHDKTIFSLQNVFLSLTSISDCSFPAGGIEHLSLNTLTVLSLTAPNLLLSDIMIPAPHEWDIPP